MPLFRGFIAIDIDISAAAKEFTNNLKNLNADLKFVKPENMHLTLKFLGNTDERMIENIRSVIEHSIKKLTPIKISFRSAGVFPGPENIKVIWIGVDDRGLLKNIANKLDTGLAEYGIKNENRSFSPHLTIARVRSLKNSSQLLHLLDEYNHTLFMEYQLDKICLIKSDLTPRGPVYTVLKEINFL